jgi:hypothetical protein
MWQLFNRFNFADPKIDLVAIRTDGYRSVFGSGRLSRISSFGVPNFQSTRIEKDLKSDISSSTQFRLEENFMAYLIFTKKVLVSSHIKMISVKS